MSRLVEPLAFAELDEQGPRYGQITRALLQAIRTGSFPPGARLPTTRDLARQLNCSRNIVLLAYEQLVLEGYLKARPRAGTFVSVDLPRVGVTEERRRASAGHDWGTLSPSGRRLVRESISAWAITRRTRRYGIDFMYGACEPDPRLVRDLRRGFGRILNEPFTFGYGASAGDAQLRAEVAQRLRGTRGMVRSAEQIVITSGAQQGLDLCARLLLSHGDKALVEEPGYEAALAAFRAAGATTIPVAVDDEGLDPAALPRRAARTRVIYVTPSHQFPTGAILTAARRHLLRAWAQARGAYIIEDDYDGELRYHGHAVRALAGSDPNDCVIYCGTFCKSLFPSIRIGYLALPDALVAAAASAKWLTDRGSSGLMQALVRTLMTNGAYDRHIRRMQRRYTARRDALVHALREHLAEEVEIAGDASGMHLVAWFPKLATSHIDALVAACQRRDVGVYSIARHALQPLRRAGLILGYGLVDERATDRGVRILAAAYRKIKPPNGSI
jgi:GntR family transcriptional regulator / MocR family aminotransferase